MTISKYLMNSNQEVPIWKLTNNNFDEWEPGKVFIQSQEKFQVCFEIESLYYSAAVKKF